MLIEIFNVWHIIVLKITYVADSVMSSFECECCCTKYILNDVMMTTAHSSSQSHVFYSHRNHDHDMHLCPDEAFILVVILLSNININVL
jgi:hypothetical protein